MRRTFITVLCVLAGAGALAAAVAEADLPYPDLPGNPTDWSQLHVPSGTLPSDLGTDDWRFFSTPESGNFPVNADPRELNGVRGGWVADASAAANTAWSVSTGRPDVVIAELDSGVEWNNVGLVIDERFKIAVNAGELPTPNHAGADLVGGSNCGSYQAKDDANGDGIFNLRDFACDSRVSKSPPNGVGPADLLDPQDLLIAFTDNSDSDGNGYRDDIAGWDFLDDDNDPFDDVQYGHGTGEIRGSTAEANNGHDIGFCPNCMAIPLRVGTSFVADDNRFAMATLYGVDRGAMIVQEALGTLNDSRLAQDAIDYAYRHGVVVIASAADEAAQHHNYPSAHEHPVVVNSVTQYSDVPPQVPKSYLAFNGCTNFSSKITLAIPSSTCSSNATEVGAGEAGLILSAAMNAIEKGQFTPNSRCRLVNGKPCPLTANEVRQLMASGTINGQTLPDDVNYLAGNPAEPSCSPSAALGCTDPNLALQQLVNANRPIASPPDSRSYPARAGHDQFFGWGRINTWRSTTQVAAGRVPPEVEINSPEWFTQVNPDRPSVDIGARVWARGAQYTCAVYAAPGSYPNNRLTTDSPPGDFAKVGSGPCDGTTQRTTPIDGRVGTISLAALKAHFPNDAKANGFHGVESGSGAGQTSNGRPNSEPYGFTIRVVATRTGGGFNASGEDRRNLYLHRDQDLLDGYPKQLRSDGESSPAFADLDGDNRNEMIFGTSDGFVHAKRRNGTDLAGWPRRTDRLPLHPGGRAYQSGEVSTETSHGAILSSPAIADLNRDGRYEVIVTDMESKVYVWNSDGSLRWKRQTNPDYSGRPLEPFVNERLGHRDRTTSGFIASPVAADLDETQGGRQEVIAAAMDRHLYVWNADGTRRKGFPVLVVDPSKVGSVDPASHQIRWDPQNAPDQGGDTPNQGAIIDTPAVGDVRGALGTSIVLGTNEEYTIQHGNEGAHNTGGFNAASLQALSPALQAADLKPANSRLYLIKPTGEVDGNPKTGDWLAEGRWPFKVALLISNLLPVVGEGITGSPVIGPVACSGEQGGERRPYDKIGVIPNNGLAYVLTPDGRSCVDGNNGVMDTDRGGGIDHPQLAAVGHPAFANFGGGVSFVAPVAGLIRALDLLVNEYQTGGQDFVAAWDPATGQYRSGFPARMNDLQFLTGPSFANIDGQPGDELVEGSAYLDVQAFKDNGQPVPGWPKLTSDWMVANPLIGTWGTRDTDASARRVVVAMTRSGSILAYRTPAPACDSNDDRPLGSWPRFHHDLANSGNYSRDAVNPGAPYDIAIKGGKLTFKTAGDDLLCGGAFHEVVQADFKITGATFDQGDPLPTPVTSWGKAGTTHTLEFGGKLSRYIAIRAKDFGNVGRTVRIPTRGPGGNLGGGDGGKCGDLNNPRTTYNKRNAVRRNKGFIEVRGKTEDNGCKTLSVAKKRNRLLVSVSVFKRIRGDGCRFLERDGRLSEARSCKRPTKLRATGSYSLDKRTLTWRFRQRAQLPTGKYVVIAKGIDQSGNVEPKKDRNRRTFTVKKASAAR